RRDRREGAHEAGTPRVSGRLVEQTGDLRRDRVAQRRHGRPGLGQCRAPGGAPAGMRALVECLGVTQTDASKASAGPADLPDEPDPARAKERFEVLFEQAGPDAPAAQPARHTSYRSEEHTSELQSRENLVCRLLLEKKK